MTARGKRSPSKASGSAEPSFPQAFAKLLRSRKISVPRGLTSAPPEAYASQPVSYVDQLADLPDAELERYAAQIAGYAKRQAARAKQEWERSPLIAELRRRKLEEPERPIKVVGASASLRKPLEKWTDAQLLRAARDWSKLGRP